MPNIFQTLRSTVSKRRPADGARKPGELFVNIADRMLGFINDAGKARDLISIPFHSPLGTYDVGDVVFQAGRIYVCKTAIAAAKAFDAADWVVYGSADFLMLAGGDMTGPLKLAAATPTDARHAVSKGYVDGAIGRVKLYDAAVVASPFVDIVWTQTDFFAIEFHVMGVTPNKAGPNVDLLMRIKDGAAFKEGTQDYSTMLHSGWAPTGVGAGEFIKSGWMLGGGGTHANLYGTTVHAWLYPPPPGILNAEAHILGKSFAAQAAAPGRRINDFGGVAGAPGGLTGVRLIWDDGAAFQGKGRIVAYGLRA
jgi:hypothetical protein